MKRTLGNPCAVAFLCFALAGFVFSETDGSRPAYHADVAEVELTFFATDPSQHSVSALAENDFAVVDQNLIVRRFSSFARADLTSLEVAVLVDCSESVGGRSEREVASALQSIGQPPAIPERSFSLILFHGIGPTVLCAGNCRTASAAREPSRGVGPTPLFDSVVFAADFISRRAGPRSKKIIILLSDGEDTISHNAGVDAIDSAIAQDVEIYSADLNPPGHFSEGAHVLRAMASATGGRYFARWQSASELLRAALDDFRAAYTVTYRVPDRAVGFHSVRILPTRDSNLRFHCREGYEYSAGGH